MNPSSELISEFKVTQFNNNAEFSNWATSRSVQERNPKDFTGALRVFSEQRIRCGGLGIEYQRNHTKAE